MNRTNTAEIISIGDELLIGQVINTNQAEIARDLNTIGIGVRSMTTVGDSLEEITAAFRAATARAGYVLVTGGLGPTHDDITRSAVCSFLGTRLVLHESTLIHIRAMFERRGMPLTPLNEDQARVPVAVDVIPNPIGTAAGYSFAANGAQFFVMPGVPFEMKAMMKESIIPRLSRGLSGGTILHRTIKTTGIAESHLAEKLGDTAELLLHQPDLTMAYLPGPFGVRLRLTGTGEDTDAVRTRIERAEQNIVRAIESYVYGFDDDEMEEVVGRILKSRGKTLAIAESCTGGLIADRITNVPGSSDYFERGYVCYSNRSKHDLLDVSKELIGSHGAVSDEVAVAMAEGARSRSGASIGLSTTGIAGPSGGTKEKPVGLVCIGLADASGSTSTRSVFGSDRRRIKERASQAALNVLRRRLLRP